MDRDQQGRLARAREPHPVGERYEVIVRARHRHPVLAGLLQLVAQLEGEIEHDGFFVVAGRRRDGAAVEAAVAGIEHDQRPRVRAFGRRFALAPRRRCRCPARLVLDREVAQEALAIDRHEIDHEPRRLALDGIEHEGLVDPHGTRDVEHDARAALHHEAEAERLDQAPAGLTGLGRQTEGHLRQVDHHAIGIGERKCAQIDLLREIHQARFAHDRKILGGSARGGAVERRDRRDAGDEEDPAERGEQALLCASTHRFLISGSSLLQ